MWQRITAWWRSMPPTKQALVAIGVAATALVLTVVAIALLDAPIWIVLVICVPVWVALRLLRYQPRRST